MVTIRNEFIMYTIPRWQFSSFNFKGGMTIDSSHHTNSVFETRGRGKTRSHPQTYEKKRFHVAEIDTIGMAVAYITISKLGQTIV